MVQKSREKKIYEIVDEEKIFLKELLEKSFKELSKDNIVPIFHFYLDDIDIRDTQVKGNWIGFKGWKHWYDKEINEDMKALSIKWFEIGEFMELTETNSINEIVNLVAHKNKIIWDTSHNTDDTWTTMFIEFE